MKIIQTLYLPHTANAAHSTLGFLSSELSWMSWALSCLQLKRYYDNVHLYTNEAGYDLLIRRLRLPYTAVHALEEFSYPDQLWAYPKIQTYSRQKEPFLHVDGDVFIWEKLDDLLLAQPLIAQNLETNASFYHSLAGRLQQQQVTLPPAIARQMQQPGSLRACNAGILGGHDLDFFQQYTGAVFDFLQTNRRHWDRPGHGDVNMLYEQVLFHALAHAHQKTISYYHAGAVNDMTYPGFAEFSGIPHTTKFIHLMGAFKRDPEVSLMLARRLRQSHPEYYAQVLEAGKQKNIAPFFNYDEANAHSPGTAPADYWQKIHQEEKHQGDAVDLTFGQPGLEGAQFQLNPRVKLAASTAHGGSSACYVPCPFRRAWIPIACDALDRLLVRCLKRPRSIGELAKQIAPYFDDHEPGDHHPSLRRLLGLRLRRGCHLNLFRVFIPKGKPASA